MKKRQKILARLIVGVAAITIGIGMWNAVWQNRTQMREQMRELKEDKSIKIELTKSEKDILKKISVDEAAIEQGMLLMWQKKLVRDMRMAEETLKTDYPSHSFQIVDGAASRTDADTESTFWFVADGEETRYVLYLTKKDGKRTIRDTFFGTLLSHPYESALLPWLQKRVPECVGCRAFFDCAVDEAYTEASLQAVREALLAGEDALANFTELYVDGTACGDPDVLAARLEQEIRRQRIYGSYEIAVLLRLPEEAEVHAETDEKENKSENIMKYIDKNRTDGGRVRIYTFSCFLNADKHSSALRIESQEGSSF